jgi:hypothetical protein
LTGSGATLVIRYPLYQCSVCHGYFEHENSRSIFAEAIAEHFEKEGRQFADRRVKSEQHQMNCYAAGGFLIAATFFQAVSNLATGHWVLTGIMFLLTGVWVALLIHWPYAQRRRFLAELVEDRKALEADLARMEVPLPQEEEV